MDRVERKTRTWPAIMRCSPPRRLGFFWPEVETTLKLGFVVLLTSVYVVMWTSNLHHRRRAETWRDIACEYRLRDVERRAPFIATGSKQQDACARLEKLGVMLSATDALDE